MSKRKTKRASYYRNRVTKLEAALLDATKRIEQLEEWKKAEVVIRTMRDGQASMPESYSKEWWDLFWKQYQQVPPMYPQQMPQGPWPQVVTGVIIKSW